MPAPPLRPRPQCEQYTLNGSTWPQWGEGEPLGLLWAQSICSALWEKNGGVLLFLLGKKERKSGKTLSLDISGSIPEAGDVCATALPCGRASSAVPRWLEVMQVHYQRPQPPPEPRGCSPRVKLGVVRLPAEQSRLQVSPATASCSQERRCQRRGSPEEAQVALMSEVAGRMQVHLLRCPEAQGHSCTAVWREGARRWDCSGRFILPNSMGLSAVTARSVTWPVGALQGRQRPRAARASQ